MLEKCIKDYFVSNKASVAHQPPNQTKMKSMIVVALALVAIAAAVPVEVKEPIQILKSEFNQQPEGGYQYTFETENGISRQENGELKEALDEENKPHQVVVVRGGYSYPGEDGKPISVTYFADESGFHAEGDSIPKPARR